MPLGNWKRCQIPLMDVGPGLAVPVSGAGDFKRPAGRRGWCVVPLPGSELPGYSHTVAVGPGTANVVPPTGHGPRARSSHHPNPRPHTEKPDGSGRATSSPQPHPIHGSDVPEMTWREPGSLGNKRHPRYSSQPRTDLGPFSPVVRLRTEGWEGPNERLSRFLSRREASV